MNLGELELDLLAARWLDALEAEIPAALALRRELHADPSGSNEEDPASRRLEHALEDVVLFDRAASTGRVGRLGPTEGPSVAVRAELDALPLTETTGAAFASTNGFMHACGHDVHQAAFVALLRAARSVDLPLGMVALLQPREETYPSGALDMTDEGVLTKHRVAHVVGAHVHPGVTTGAIAVGGGFINAAADEIDIRLTGQGGHGAYPHDGSDTVAAAAHISLSLPELVRRTVSPLNPAVISIGTVTIGDGAANVLPRSAHIRATVRTTDADDRARLHAAIRASAGQLAGGFGVAAEVTVTQGEPMLVNDPDLAARVSTVLFRLGLERAEAMRSLGADDFSYFSDAVPSVMLFVGVETDAAAPQPALHDPRFLPTERAVRDVARALMSGYLAAVDRVLDGSPAAAPAMVKAEPPTDHPSVASEGAS